MTCDCPYNDPDCDDDRRCPDCELDGHLSDIADDTWTTRQERGAA